MLLIITQGQELYFSVSVRGFEKLTSVKVLLSNNNASRTIEDEMFLFQALDSILSSSW